MAIGWSGVHSLQAAHATGRLAQCGALTMGVAFVALAVGGSFATGFEGFAHHSTGHTILGFQVNPLHNAVHLVSGVLGLVAFHRLSWSLAYGLFLAVMYGLIFFYGLFAIGFTWDVLSLNWAGNWLHFGLAIVGLTIASLANTDLARDRPLGCRPPRGAR